MPIPSPQPLSDVTILFAHFGTRSDVARYQEIWSDADAGAAAARWPLMAEWLDSMDVVPEPRP